MMRSEQPGLSAESPSLEGRAYVALRDALIQGAFPPGERLSIRRIAAALGVSPMPVRAALSRLAAERCLDIAPGGGAVVPLITRDAYREITRVRLLLEPEAAAASVPNLGDAEIASLRRLAENARRARAGGDEDTYREGDRVLHQRYYAAAGQPFLMSLIEMVWMRRSPVLALARAILPLRPDADDHAALLDAAAARDPQAAAEAARSEIIRASDYILARLRFPEDPPAEGWSGLKRLVG